MIMHKCLLLPTLSLAYVTFLKMYYYNYICSTVWGVIVRSAPDVPVTSSTLSVTGTLLHWQHDEAFVSLLFGNNDSRIHDSGVDSGERV